MYHSTSNYEGTPTNAGSRYQYSLEEYPTNMLSNYPNTERGKLRLNGWGSIQRQQSTNIQEKESFHILFFIALAVFSIAILYKLLQHKAS